MTSLLSLAGEHLAGIGLAPGLFGNLSASFDTGDILGMALRVALIGVCAAAIRACATRVKSAVMESE